MDTHGTGQGVGRLARHAIVVGVGPGLGRSLALRYARAGYDLTLLARSATSVEPVATAVRALGRSAWPVEVDISDLGELDTVITQAGARGPVELLHHNAAVNVGGLLGADPDTLRQALDVSVVAAVVAVQAALPDLRATAGTVAWTGGGIALHPRGDFGVLAAGKAAMRAAGFALADELVDRGVRLRMLTVNGFIRPGGRFDPDRIAAAFWDFLAADDGQVERIYNGRD